MPQLSRRDVLGALGAAAALGAAGCAAPPGRVRRGASARFLLPDDLVFLNTGSLGACPEVVLDRTMEAWRRLELAPVYEGFGPLVADADEARGRAAAFLGASADEVFVTHNTTDSMHLVAEGVALRQGDHVLTTDHEHEGGSCCWEHAARHRGVVIDRVRLPVPAADGEQIVRLFADAMTPNTRVVSVSHVTYTTGLRLPVRRIADVVRPRGALLVVDGAQSAGAVRIDVEGLGCDAYATSGHKWMLGPKGLGLLYVDAAARERIQPGRLSDGPSVYTGATGSGPLPAIVGLGAAVDFLQQLGPDAIERHSLALRDRLYGELRALDGVRVVSPPPGPLAAPIVSVAVADDVDPAALKVRLRKRHRVSVKSLVKGDLKALRFSTHLYNSEADVEALLRALAAELRAGPG